MGAEVKRTIRLALSGYYGYGNSGDEAVLQSILQALERQGQVHGLDIQPVVLSARPEWTSRLYGVEAVHRMHPGDVYRALSQCDGLISGGGSLLQDATSARTIPYYLTVLKLAQGLSKPTFVYAQGIGPVRRPLFHRMIRHVLGHCVYVSVRDPESADLLARMGLDAKCIDIVPDPVMGMRDPEDRPIEPEAFPDRPCIGVSVRYWRQDRGELDALAEALDRIMERTAAHVRLLPFHEPSDREASRYLADRMKHGRTARTTIAPECESPLAMFREVGRCDALIGMRLHSLIYAAAQYVPLLGISYDPKIDHFLRRIEAEAVGTTERLDPARVADQTASLLAGGTAWRASKSPLVDALKRDAVRPAARIADYFRRRQEGGERP